MYGIDLTEEQRERLFATVGRHLAYFDRLHLRMTEVRFPADDPLMLQVTRTLLALRETYLVLNDGRRKGRQINMLKRAKAWRKIG